MYTAHQWKRYKQGSVQKLTVAQNDGMRLMAKIPRLCSATTMFVSVVQPTSHAVLQNVCRIAVLASMQTCNSYLLTYLCYGPTSVSFCVLNCQYCTHHSLIFEYAFFSQKRKRKHGELNQGEIDSQVFHEKVRFFFLYEEIFFTSRDFIRKCCVLHSKGCINSLCISYTFVLFHNLILHSLI